MFIDLMRNNLTIIKTNTFDGLNALEFLYLSHNYIDLIEEGALNLPDLKRIHLNFNRLTTVSDHIFSQTPLIEHIELRWNNLSTIEHAFSGLLKLQTLHLDHNEMVGISLSVFLDLPSLLCLSLHESGRFVGSTTAEAIDGASISSVQNLDISSNHLTGDYDLTNLLYFKELEVLNIENNDLETMNVANSDLRENFSKLESVFLSGNKWNCEWLNEFISNNKKKNILFPSTS